MASLPSLLDPKAYIRAENERRIAHELDIATEIFLAERCVRIHYEDLMGDIQPEHASKQMLLGWLNDNTRQGVLVRSGIIRMYMSEHPDDFIEGTWQPLHFGQFIAFAATKLTDKELVGKTRSQQFALSIQSADWFSKSATVMGLKLLEQIHRRGALKSILAKAILDLNANSRELLEANGRIVGRAARNNGADHEFVSQAKETLERFYKAQSQLFLKRHEQHEETKIYLSHKAAIESAIQQVPKLLQLN